MRNREILLQVADQIERQPERYDQETWGPHDSFTNLDDAERAAAKNFEGDGCGGAFCIAGTAVALAGWRPTIEEDIDEYVVTWETVVHPAHPSFAKSVEDVAAALLGLNGDESRKLFDEDWEPRPDLTVPQALRKLAEGASLEEVCS